MNDKVDGAGVAPKGYRFVRVGEEIKQGDIIAFSNSGRSLVKFGEDGKVLPGHAAFFDAFQKWAGGKEGRKVGEGDHCRIIRIWESLEIGCSLCGRKKDLDRVCWWCGAPPG